MRRFCSSVYCWHRGKILLIEHKKLGIWLPVGGGREGEETPQETAFRELVEETGIARIDWFQSPVEGAPRGYFGYTEYTTPWGDIHMVHMFIGQVSSTEVKPDEGFSSWQWFTPDEMIVLEKTTANVRWAGSYIKGLGIEL